MFSLNLGRLLKFEKALSKTMAAKEARNLQTVFSPSYRLLIICNVFKMARSLGTLMASNDQGSDNIQASR
jgi:hypothetical protein